MDLRRPSPVAPPLSGTWTLTTGAPRQIVSASVRRLKSAFCEGWTALEAGIGQKGGFCATEGTTRCLMTRSRPRGISPGSTSPNSHGNLPRRAAAAPFHSVVSALDSGSPRSSSAAGKPEPNSRPLIISSAGRTSLDTRSRSWIRGTNRLTRRLRQENRSLSKHTKPDGSRRRSGALVPMRGSHRKLWARH